MPVTYQLISSNVLGSAAASVTFSSIPATYTDLVLRLSVRSDRPSSLVDSIKFTFNTSTANFSSNRMEGNGAASTASATTLSYPFGRVTASNVTANTFSSIEFYIPNYTVSQNKPLSASYAYENNATTAYVGAIAGLWSNTAALTSIEMGLVDGPNFVAGSSFYLYGISKS